METVYLVFGFHPTRNHTWPVAVYPHKETAIQHGRLADQDVQDFETWFLEIEKELQVHRWQLADDWDFCYDPLNVAAYRMDPRRTSYYVAELPFRLHVDQFLERPPTPPKEDE